MASRKKDAAETPAYVTDDFDDIMPQIVPTEERTASAQEPAPSQPAQPHETVWLEDKPDKPVEVEAPETEDQPAEETEDKPDKPVQPGPAPSAPRESTPELTILARQVGLAPHEMRGMSASQLAAEISHRIAHRPTLDEAPPAEESFDVRLGLPTEGEGEDVYDPKLIKAIESQLTEIKKDYRQQVARLESDYGTDRKAREAARSAETERTIDAWFESAGDEWKEHFGTGSIRSLQADSAEVDNRLQVVAPALVLHEAFPDKSLEDWLDFARHGAFRNNVKTRAIDSVRRDLAGKKKQALRKGRTEAAIVEQVGDEAAGDFADQWFKDRGIVPAE